MTGTLKNSELTRLNILIINANLLRKVGTLPITKQYTPVTVPTNVIQDEI